VSFVGLPEHPIEVSSLPQPAAYPETRDVSGSLLRIVDERAQICRIGLTFDKHVNVIWHEAVRWNSELLLAGCTPKCHGDVANQSCTGEVSPSLERAYRQEVLMATHVREPRQTRRAHPAKCKIHLPDLIDEASA
jgi:hypothetical protein